MVGQQPDLGIGGLAAELGTLGELDTVGGGLHAGISDFAGVAHRTQEERRDGRPAARSRHRRPAGRTRDSWRTRYRWWRPARWYIRLCGSSAPHPGRTARWSARRPISASAACRQNSGLLANSIPLVAACTLVYPTLRE